MHESETEEPLAAGALEELARDPSSRKRFLKAAGGTGAASAFGLFLAACGSQKQKLTAGGSNPNTGAGVGTDRYGPGDIGIVRYALTLEYLETEFYAAAIKSGKLKGRAATLVKRLGAQEAQHVKALEGTVTKLGAKPPLKPKGQQFPLGSAQSILRFALTVENLGAAAYLGQADRIRSKELLAAALAIHSVEGRHAAALAALLGQNPTPEGAFAQPAAALDVLTQLHTVTAKP
jgi:rubrerythrin